MAFKTMELDEIILGVECKLENLRTELYGTVVFKDQGEKDRLGKKSGKWPVAWEKNQEGMVFWELSEESFSRSAM